MIDFHSHILPRIDDGSSSVEESLLLLELLSAQKIETVAATPHFIANSESVERFLLRRNMSFSLLSERSEVAIPNIRLGAEVAYYEGISRLCGLEKLCMEGTNILLLEMPESKWTKYTLSELVELTLSGTMTVMIAHIERSLLKQNSNVAERLIESGVIMQSNASFFINSHTRRKACKLLRHGFIHVLGSDCHNIHIRPPRIGEAIDIIKKRNGEAAIREIIEYGNNLLSPLR